MRALIAALITSFISIHGFAAIPIQPTTTLSAETSNNTSTANSFKSQSNGNIGARNVSKLPIRDLLYQGSTTKIYVHLMPWFGPSNHMDVGYESASATQVKRQAADMISRGIDGAIVDWYGPESTHHDAATMLLMEEAERNPGFEFAITEDVGSLRTVADPQQKLIDDLNHVNSVYASSPAYMRRGGRPVIFFFGIETLTTPINWDVVRAGVLGNPLFIFRNSTAFTKPQTNGGFGWLVPQSTLTDGYMSLDYLDNFYTVALAHPTQKTFGSAFKGFDDSLAAWTKNRKIKQFCGQTWLASMARAGKFYSSGKQLENLQIVTWNDYEEGSEIESGIDNCVSIAAWVEGSALRWKITGNENTIAHYTVFISEDGQNLMKLAQLARGNRSLNLESFDPGEGSYTLYVKAVGKPSIVNHMSNAAGFPAKVNIAASPASLSLQAGQSGNITVSVTPQSGGFHSAVTLSCAGLPAPGRCAFSPASVTPGAQSASSTLTVFTSSTSVKNKPASDTDGMLYAFWLAGAGIFGAVLRAPKSGSGKRRWLALAALLFACALSQVGCGSTANTATPSQRATTMSGAYTVVITGTAGSEQFSTTVSVVVQ